MDQKTLVQVHEEHLHDSQQDLQEITLFDKASMQHCKIIVIMERSYVVDVYY